MRAALLAAWLFASTVPVAQAVSPVDSTAEPPPPPGWTLDLAPPPPEPPRSLAEGERRGLLPGLTLEPIVPGQDRRLPMSDLFGDGHSLFYGGDLLEDPARGHRFGGAATIPF